MRRLLALLISLSLSGVDLLPCAAADREPEAGCHLPARSISTRCECGCTHDLPRSTPSHSSSQWALPAPRLLGAEPAAPSEPRDADPSVSEVELPGIDHVPIAA